VFGRITNLVRQRPCRGKAGPLIVLLLAAVVLMVALVRNTPPAVPLTMPATLAPWSHEPIQPLLDAPLFDRRKVALGKALFEDARLSGKGALPCSACHDVSTNGARAARGTTRTDTPTIFNASGSSRLGWDGHDRTLEEQALATLQAPMIAQGVSIDAMLDRLRSDPSLDQRVREAFGHGIDRPTVLDAIATYERSLVTPGSRFDRWLAGDRRAIDARERRGYERFKKLGCVSCHQAETSVETFCRGTASSGRLLRQNPQCFVFRACAT
jgi:cytochrome c peroxidase